MKKIIFLSLLLAALCLSSAYAQVDSQWRGPDRDGKYHNEKLLKSWPEGGPELMISLDNLGDGYSSPAVTNDRFYVTGMKDEKGYLYCFDLTGKELWSKVYSEEWSDDFPGPRTSPTIVGDRIYFMNSFGTIFCYNDTGEKIWSLDMAKEFDMPELRFGAVEALAIEYNYLFCTPGSEDVAVAVINRHDGTIIRRIKGNGQIPAYCSPVIITHNNRRIFVTRLEQSVIGIDTDKLEMIFEYVHTTPYDLHANTPLYYDGYIYVVSPEGWGGHLIKLSEDGTQTTPVWSNAKMDCIMGGVVLVDGYLYGSGDENRNWHCIDFMTGEHQYSSRKLGRQGTIIFADDMLYIYSEKGDIALVNPNSSKFDIVSSFKLKDGTGEHITHPVIKNGRLYVRHGNILNIYNIAG